MLALLVPFVLGLIKMLLEVFIKPTKELPSQETASPIDSNVLARPERMVPFEK